MAFVLEGYIDVAERIRKFKEAYPQGSLQPANLAQPYQIITIGERLFIVYVAAAYRTPDDLRPGIGMAMESFPGKTNYTRDSELMNAETSAWGRAIVAALAADTQKIASLEEVRNRQVDHPAVQPAPPKPQQQATIVSLPAYLSRESAPDNRTKEEMVADADRKSEILKASNQPNAQGKPANVAPLSNAITDKQVKLLCKLLRDAGVEDFVKDVARRLNRDIEELTQVTKREATVLIGSLVNGGA